ncbi:hypothetical protein [Fimbriiglobus ruber]|uniref:Uncharacterized protein n=1 Tax=Fimbriiglobus ruber TaxID=1908690 RepID=A0A225E1J5_9BACT|nr:hypothetical protein [Fimbriiglobus ruber]OWK43896.1 hypothetical protein FRUB_03495 [Fimbriiglobus ruber]
MRYTILTGVIALLASAPVATAQSPAKEAGTVSWQYYSGTSAVGSPIQPAEAKANIRCSVISSDGDGDWVCLYVAAVPKSVLPGNASADTCRPVGKDGKPFKLTNTALLPDHDTTQLVPFDSGNTEAAYKLVIKKDGSISIETIRPTFAGETSMTAAASVCWYVSKKK